MLADSLTHITRHGNWFDTGLEAGLDRLLAAMRRAKADKALLAGVPTLDQDELILSACREHPGRFLPVAGLDTAMDRDAMEKRILDIKQKGFLGIKIHPRLCGTPLLSNAVRQAIECAGKHGLTALVCTVQRPPLPPLGRPLYDALHELCAQNRDTKIILVHGGYFDLLATSEVVRPFENILVDLSLTLLRFKDSSIRHDIQYLIRTFDKRITVGSDFPEATFSDVLATLTGLGFRLQDLDRKGILGDNLLRFLERG